ncbi:YtcA family lipoprotein [Orbus sturtevantii]|uniref:YtcA family lipoprotein n=1 Tax=Orbus sturtevantii TaxID=3074109 RepID=UPI00370D40E1
MFGSYFPSWIFYFIFSIIITLLLRVLFIKIGFDNLIGYKLLFYISLMLILAFLSSFLFF